jgi:hypothetical protein
VVERSTSNGAFVSLDTVRAAGGIYKNDYHAVDAAPAAGTNVYRIKEMDIDGRFDYSVQVLVKKTGTAAALNIYPNPASGSTRIGLPGNMTKAALQLYNISGVLVKNIQVSNGQIIDLKGLTPGVYTIVAVDGMARYVEQLIIQ